MSTEENQATQQAEDIAVLKNQMETVMTNHLPHLQLGLDEVNSKLWALIITLGTGMLGIIIALIALIHFS